MSMITLETRTQRTLKRRQRTSERRQRLGAAYDAGYHWMRLRTCYEVYWLDRTAGRCYDIALVHSQYQAEAVCLERHAERQRWETEEAA